MGPAEHSLLDRQVADAMRLASRDPNAAARLFEPLRAATLSPVARLRLGVAEAEAAQARFELPTSAGLAARLLPQARALDERELVARLLLVLASARFELGEREQAQADAAEAERVARASGDVTNGVAALLLQAGLDVRLGRFGSAAMRTQQAEQLGAGSNDPGVRAKLALGNALLAGQLDDTDSALPLLVEAASAFGADGDLIQQADAVRNRASLLLRSADPAAALEPAEQALALYKKLADAYGRASAMSDLAMALSARGEHARAAATAAQAVHAMRSIDEGDSLSLALRDQARVLLAAGRADEARPLVESVRQRAAASTDQRLKLNDAQLRRQLHALLGQWRDAYAAAAQELDLQRARTAELQARQLAVQRGRMEVQQVAAALARERRQAESQRAALVKAENTGRLQTLLLVLGVAVIAVTVWALLRVSRRNRQSMLLAQTDALTGLPNRRQLAIAGAQRLADCRRRGLAFSAVMIDIDHFKQVNDRHGHATGDAVLRSVGHALQTQMRGGDLVARYGGEEFSVLLPGSRLEAAQRIAERLRIMVCELAGEDMGLDRGITISLGVAQARGGEDLDALLSRADRALYAAKHGGRNRVVADEIASH
jgi:diguanylate cyclase (GGDEF)-like protein